mgnify:FL=1
MLDQVYPAKTRHGAQVVGVYPSEYSWGNTPRIFGMIIAHKIIIAIVQFSTLYNARHSVLAYPRHYDIAYPMNVQYGAF